jgi:hypothetical protein
MHAMGISQANAYREHRQDNNLAMSFPSLRAEVKYGNGSYYCRTHGQVYPFPSRRYIQTRKLECRQDLRVDL